MITVITALAAAIIAAFCTYKWTMAIVKETVGKIPDWKVYWTPTSERLPKVGKSVMVAYIPNESKSGRAKTALGRLYEDGKFGIDNLGKVIAWAARPIYHGKPEQHDR